MKRKLKKHSNVYRACSIVTNLDIFAQIMQQIWYQMIQDGKERYELTFAGTSARVE
jgi:hypothetical protein